MSNRDELSGLVNRADWTARAEAITDAILAAGWRPPARTIATAEELDALPSGSVVMSCFGDASTVRRDNPLIKPADFHHLVKYGPATVLYEPEPQS